MLAHQDNPRSLEILNQQFDELENALLEVSELYQSHPEPFQFGHVLAFNCLWRWQYYYFVNPSKEFLETFQSISGINQALVEKSSLHYIPYKWAMDMDPVMSNISDTKLDNKIEEALKAQDSELVLQLLNQKMHPPQNENLTESGLIKENSEHLLHEEKILKLFQFGEEIAKSSESIKLSVHLNSRVRKIACLFTLFKFGLFTREFLKSLWELDVRHADEMSSTLSRIYCRTNADKETIQKEIKFLFSHANQLKTLSSALAYLHQHEISSDEFLDNLIQLPEDKMQLLNRVELFPNQNSILADKRFKPYDKLAVAKALFVSLFKDSSNSVTPEEKSCCEDQVVNFKVKVKDLKEALAYHEELNHLSSPRDCSLKIPENGEENDEVELRDNQLIELWDLVNYINYPYLPPHNDELLFQFKKKVRESNIAHRLLGQERERYLKNHACSDFDVLGSFLLEPAKYTFLSDIYGIFHRIPSLDHIHTDRVRLSIQDLWLLKPFIDAEDSARIAGIICGLRWLNEFDVMDQKKMTVLKEFPLGMQLLAQVGIPNKDVRENENKTIAEFIYESLLPLIQSPEVQAYFKSLPPQRFSPPLLKGGNADRLPESPSSMEKHTLSNNDILQVVKVIEHGSLRHKALQILDAQTHLVKHTFIDTKLHNYCTQIALLPNDKIMIVSSYCHLSDYEQAFFLGGAKPLHRMKIWDLKTNTCIKESADNYSDTSCFKLLTGNRIAYQDQGEILIYNPAKDITEFSWPSPNTHHSHYNLVIGNETEESLTIKFNDRKIILRKETPEETFSLSRHWLFSQPQALAESAVENVKRFVF